MTLIVLSCIQIVLLFGILGYLRNIAEDTKEIRNSTYKTSLYTGIM